LKSQFATSKAGRGKSYLTNQQETSDGSFDVRKMIMVLGVMECEDLIFRFGISYSALKNHVVEEYWRSKVKEEELNQGIYYILVL